MAHPTRVLLTLACLIAGLLAHTPWARASFPERVPFPPDLSAASTPTPIPAPLWDGLGPARPFAPGEEITFKLRFLRLPAGSMTLQTLPPVEIDGRTALHIRGHVETGSLAGLFYKYLNIVDVFIEPIHLAPVQVWMDLRGRNRTERRLFRYDHDTGEVDIWRKRVRRGQPREVREQVSARPMVQNLFSAIYYVRAQPITLGEGLMFDVLNNQKAYRMEVRAVRRETLKTDIGRIQTLVMEPRLFQDDQPVRDQGAMQVWVTDDERRIPVRLRADAPIGSIQGLITAYRPGQSPAGLSARRGR